MRGRLIFPMIIELAQLDTSATSEDPDNGGPLTSGYDDVFREPVKVLDGFQTVSSDGEGVEVGEDRVVLTAETPNVHTGNTVRKESIIEFKAQVSPSSFRELEAFMTGPAHDSRFYVMTHYKELDRLGLVDADGMPTIRTRDRLVKIKNVKGQTITKVPSDKSPQLYVREVQPRGYGPGGTVNLLKIVFEERERGLRQG